MIPIYDNHVHLDPRGRHIEAAKEFKNAGGTGFTLVNLPYGDITVSSAEDILEQYRRTISTAEKVRELDLRVNVAVGPYPILLVSLSERFGIGKAERIMIRGMEIAAELVSEGKANAIGEIGRPHFQTSQEINETSERILFRGMDLAKECDCPVIIHSESSPDTAEWLRSVADRASLDPGKVIKHLSPPWVLEEENHGIMPSIAASRSGIREALSKGDRFLIETDYIDDPDRPDVVLPVTTVPKRVKGLLSSSELNEEIVWKICHDIPKGLYDRK